MSFVDPVISEFEVDKLITYLETRSLTIFEAKCLMNHTIDILNAKNVFETLKIKSRLSR